jgi:hypothetical protein
VAEAIQFGKRHDTLLLARIASREDRNGAMALAAVHRKMRNARRDVQEVSRTHGDTFPEAVAEP